jgi:hypothetical protein
MDASSAAGSEANELVNNAQRLTASDEFVKIDVEIVVFSVARTFENNDYT